VRDPERIERILKTLKKTWEAEPDLRLGQLIVNSMRSLDLFHMKDLFYVEDEDMEELIGVYHER
jgi:uncharacterized protein YihD (DUF1040 family)